MTEKYTSEQLRYIKIGSGSSKIMLQPDDVNYVEIVDDQGMYIDFPEDSDKYSEVVRLQRFGNPSFVVKLRNGTTILTNCFKRES